MKPKLNQEFVYGWQLPFIIRFGFFFSWTFVLLWIFHLWPLSQNWCFRKKDFHPNFCAASKWASLVCRIFYQGLGQKTCNDETYWRDENKFMKKRFWLLCEADFGDFGSRLKLRKPKDFCFLKLCNVIIDIGIFTLQFIVKLFYFIHIYCELFTTSIMFVLDDLSTIWLCEWISFKKPLKCEFATVVLWNQNGELSILTKSWHLMTRCCARHFKQISHYSKVFFYFQSSYIGVKLSYVWPIDI